MIYVHVFFFAVIHPPPLWCFTKKVFCSEVKVKKFFILIFSLPFLLTMSNKKAKQKKNCKSKITVNANPIPSRVSVVGARMAVNAVNPNPGRVSAVGARMVHDDEKKSPESGSVLKTISYDLSRPAINIGVIGEVSCGKSTLLNSIFVNKYGNVSKRRSTMSINIYQQNTANERILSDQEINSILTKHEKQFVQNNDNQLQALKEYRFAVPATDKFGGYDTKIARYGLNFVDIPGFNDRVSNQLLLNWLRDQVYLLDVIFFIIDGERALNTESEVKLLDAVLDHIVKLGDIQLFIIFNKFDNKYDDDLKELCEQAQSVVSQHCQSRNITSYQFIPFAAEFAYIYRHLYYKQTLQGLETKQQIKLGVEEFGKKAKQMDLTKLETELISNLGGDYAQYEQQMHGFAEFNAAFEKEIVQRIEQRFGEKIRRLLNCGIGMANSVAEITASMEYGVDVARTCGPNIGRFVEPQLSAICEKFLTKMKSSDFVSFIQGIKKSLVFMEKYSPEKFWKLFYAKMMHMVANLGVIEFWQQISPMINEKVRSYIRTGFATKIKEIVVEKTANMDTLPVSKKNNPKEPVSISKLIDFVDVMAKIGSVDSHTDELVALMVEQARVSSANFDEICDIAQAMSNKMQHSRMTISALMKLMQSYKKFRTCPSLQQLEMIGGVLVHYPEIAMSFMNEFMLSKIDTTKDPEQYTAFLWIQNFIEDGRISAKSNYDLYKTKFFALPFDRRKTCTYQWQDYQKYPNIVSCLSL